MGCWGMGITQSDEYADVYERFMEEYDKGKDVQEITDEIIAGYLEEFSEDDGVLHDVYFALAKAQWMCCALAKELLEKVQQIVDSGSNIEFLRELEADDRDLKIRQKYLEKFLEGLKNQKASPRKRKPPTKERQLPPVEPGDCLAYKFEDGYRIAVVLDIVKEARWKPMVFSCIMRNTFNSFDINLFEEEIGLIGCYTAMEFLAKLNFKKVSSITVGQDAKQQILETALVLGSKTDFKKDFSQVQSKRLSELLEAKDILGTKLQRSNIVYCTTSRIDVF